MKSPAKKEKKKPKKSKPKAKAKSKAAEEPADSATIPMQATEEDVVTSREPIID